MYLFGRNKMQESVDRFNESLTILLGRLPRAIPKCAIRFQSYSMLLETVIVKDPNRPITEFYDLYHPYWDGIKKLNYEQDIKVTEKEIDAINTRFLLEQGTSAIGCDMKTIWYELSPATQTSLLSWIKELAAPAVTFINQLQDEVKVQMNPYLLAGMTGNTDNLNAEQKQILEKITKGMEEYEQKLGRPVSGIQEAMEVGKFISTTLPLAKLKISPPKDKEQSKENSASDGGGK